MEVPAIVRGRRVPAKDPDKVPAKEGRTSTGQADLTRGKWEKEGCPGPRSTNREDGVEVTVFRRQPCRPSNSGESAIPESRATRATTSPIARN